MDDHSDLGFKPDAAAAQATPHADLGFQPEQPKEHSWFQDLKDVAGDALSSLNPIPAVQGLAKAIRHPGLTYDAMKATQGHILDRAEDSWKKGNYGEATSHFINGMIPLLGPLAEDVSYGTHEESKHALGNSIGMAVGSKLIPKVAEAVTSKAANATAGPLYRSALKPGVADAPTLADAATQVKTGLENSIPVTEAGTGKLSGLVKDYQNKIRGAVDAGDRAGATVDPNRVASRINDVRDRFSQQVNPTKDLKAIDASRQEFLEQQGFQPGQPAQPPQPTGVLDASGQPVMKPGAPAVPPRKAQPMSVGEAQNTKIGTYQQVKSKFGEMSTAQVEAQKALARGLKEELETRLPELKGLNEQEGKLLDLQGSLERAVRRAGNHDILGVGDAAVTGAGAVAGGAPGAATAAFLKKVFDAPGAKSRLAIALSKTTGATSKRIGYSAALGSINSAIDEIVSDHDAAAGENAQYKPGDMVHLNDGKPVTIKKLNGDGTFEH